MRWKTESLSVHQCAAGQRRDPAGSAGPHGGMVMAGLVAILCSGQGGQHPAMFDLVADCPEAEPIFAAAAGVLGQDPRLFVRNAAEAALFSDFSGQILCCTQALAAWTALGAVRPARAVIAGYSVGELAAWGMRRRPRWAGH